MKNKKALWITLISLDFAVTLFLFVVSIIMLATMPSQVERRKMEAEGVKNFIQWFQMNPTAYLLIGVIPLFLLLGLNIFLLVRYIKSGKEKKALALKDLDEAQKEELRKELLKDLQDK